MRGPGSGHVTCGPMRGLEINFTGRGHTYIRTDGHRNSMTESAHWADSVKIVKILRYRPPTYSECFVECVIQSKFVYNLVEYSSWLTQLCLCPSAEQSSEYQCSAIDFNTVQNRLHYNAVLWSTAQSAQCKLCRSR